MAIKKKYNGKIYTSVRVYSNKQGARQYATTLRVHQGQLARVVKIGNDWHVLMRTNS